MFKRIVNIVEVLALAAACAVLVLLFVVQPDSQSAARTAGTGSADAGAYLPETGALPTNGREIFAANCARCHGNDGRGGIGPQLADRVADRFPDVEDEIVVVTRGRGSMPSFKGTLSDAEIRDVVEYTRTELGH